MKHCNSPRLVRRLPGFPVDSPHARWRALLLLWLAAWAAVPAPARADFVLGVATHLTRAPRPIDQSLEAIAQAGVLSLRDDADWSRVEQQRGMLKIPAQWDEVIDGAIKRGIQPLLILDYGNKFYDGGGKPHTEEGIAAFIRYVEFLVRHYQGRVKRYEVWNEWDHGPGNASAASADAYLRLVRRVHSAIKQIDPEVEVIAGAITPVGIREGFLARLVDQGVLEHADAISLHPYVHCNRAREPEDWARWMRQVGEDLQRRAGRPVPVYLTEMAWPAHRGPCGVSAEVQAEHLTRMFLLAKTMPFIKGIWWYDLQNDGPDPRNREHNFGLLDHELRPKPAYRALQRIASIVREGEYVGTLPIGRDQVHALRFRHGDANVFAIWPTDAATCQKARITASEKLPFKTIPMQGAAQPLPWTTGTRSANRIIHQTELELSSMPRLISVPAAALGEKSIMIQCSPKNGISR